MLKIAQSDSNVRPGWWEWSVWLDGTPTELDGVEEVTYILHPTFPEPVLRVRDRSTKFLLRSSGWGEFTIRAEARGKDGVVRKLTHALKLHVASEAEPPAPSKDGGSTVVFLSHAAIDARLAGEVARSLESRGWTVTTSAKISSDRSWADSLRACLSSSSRVVSLETDTSSQTHEDELAKAKEVGKPVLHVRIGGQPAKIQPTALESMVQLPERVSIEKITDQVIQFAEPGVKAAPEAKPPTRRAPAATPRRKSARR